MPHLLDAATMPKRRSKKARAQRNRNIRELVAQFAALYGTDETRLQGWIDICCHVGVDASTSITECKKNLRAVNINIWDLKDAQLRGELPRRFDSKQDLRDDIKRDHDNRAFPLQAAKDNGFLTALLVLVF